jgi:hypothetical protein
VRIHFVVLATNVAYGLSEQAAHIRPADAERRTLQDSRQRQAAEALAHAQRIDAAIAERGLARVLASGRASTLLESDGEWNWWQVSQAMKAAEALPPASPQAAAALSAALDLLREAHRRGNAPIALEQADTMHPVASGRCQPSDAER